MNCDRRAVMLHGGALPRHSVHSFSSPPDEGYVTPGRIFLRRLKRPHSALATMTPHEFTATWHQENEALAS